MVFEDTEHIVYLGLAVTNQGTQSKTSFRVSEDIYGVWFIEHILVGFLLP